MDGVLSVVHRTTAYRGILAALCEYRAVPSRGDSVELIHIS